VNRSWRFNPARRTGPALFVGGWALAQLWLFSVAPLVGGVLGGVVYRYLGGEKRKVEDRQLLAQR
jgi:aquaporin Z